MGPDSQPHQSADERVSGGRIETTEVAPHAAVLVAGDEQRPSIAGAALLVPHVDRGQVVDRMTRIACATAQVEVLAMQEVGFVETAEANERGSRKEHAGARYRVDALGRGGGRHVDHVDATATTKPRQPSRQRAQGASQGRIATAAGRLDIALAIKDAHTQHAGVIQLPRCYTKPADDLAVDQAIGIEDQQGIAGGHASTSIAGRAEAQVVRIAQHAQSRIGAKPRFDGVGLAVLRCVVDEHQLDPRFGGEHAFDAAQGQRAAVGGNDDDAGEAGFEVSRHESGFRRQSPLISWSPCSRATFHNAGQSRQAWAMSRSSDRAASAQAGASRDSGQSASRGAPWRSMALPLLRTISRTSACQYTGASASSSNWFCRRSTTSARTKPRYSCSAATRVGV